MTSRQPDDGAPDAIAEALLDLVQKTHGPLEGEELERVRGTLDGLRRASQAMAAYPLTNADEPDPIFAALRGT